MFLIHSDPLVRYWMLENLPRDKEETGGKKICFYRRTLRILNEVVLKKMVTFIFRMRKLKLLGHIIKEEGLQNLTLAGHIER